jgi:protein-tyrosine phosphatase
MRLSVGWWIAQTGGQLLCSCQISVWRKQPVRNNIQLEFKRLLDQLSQRGLRLTLLAGLDKATRILGGRIMWRFSRISPQIILGGQPARRVLARLGRRGVTGIINMRQEYDYAAEVGNARLNYLYLPTEDNIAPALDDLRKGVEFIQTEVKQGGSVYIHCMEGLGRGPTMAAAYLVSTGCSPEQAWRKIQTIRPFIRPMPEQQEQLARFAQQWQVDRDSADVPAGVEVEVLDDADIEPDDTNPPTVAACD